MQARVYGSSFNMHVCLAALVTHVMFFSPFALSLGELLSGLMGLIGLGLAMYAAHDWTACVEKSEM